MSALSIQPTFPIFTETDGLPLENGYIWIGAANLDPQGNPINVYWDAALTIAAPQPIRTLNGYPSRNGTPGRLYVNSDYSIRVQNSKGSMVYSALAATERYSEAVISAINASQVTYDPPFSGATSTNQEEVNSRTLSVQDFGAVADGVTNNAIAFAAAEAAAFADARVLVFPSGDYATDTAQVYRCSISGYGAKIINTNGLEIVSSNGAIIRAGADNTFFEGITVDGNSTATGFQNNGFDNVDYRDCTALYCLNTGFIAFNAKQGSYTNCRVDGVIYAAAQLIRADGFYAESCDDFSYVNCIAENFERIGFVSEGAGGIDSNRPRFVSCLAKDAANCDRSPTEYNSGFWCENTNGAFLDDISCINIGSGVGQTSGRVTGVTLNGTGNSTASINTLTNFIIGENAARILNAVAITSAINTASFVIENGYITFYARGVAPQGTMDSLTVRNVTFKDGNYTTAGTGCVTFDSVSINQITIDNIREINATYTDTDAASINWISASGGDKNLTITNCKGITTKTASGLNNVVIDNCYLYKRSSNFDLIAQNGLLTVSNTIVEQLSGNATIFNGAVCGNTAETLINNTKFVSISSFNTFKGLRLSFNNCLFSETRLDWNTNLNDCLLKVNNCTWKNTTLECIRTQFYNNTNDTFIVQNNTFLTGAAVAILKRNFDPDYVILQGNTYNNAALTDLTTTSSVNNVATP